MEYQIEDRSVTAHCCFGYSVMRSADPRYPVCECIDEADAQLIVSALNNAAEIARLRKALVWAVRHSAFYDDAIVGLPVILGYWMTSGYFQGEPDMVTLDSTDESLIETLCRLAQEGE